MKTLEPPQWHCFGVLIVSCEYTLHFVLTADFKEANVCGIHIEKTNTFEDKTGISCAVF